MCVWSGHCNFTPLGECVHLSVWPGVSTIAYLFPWCPDVCVVTHRREGTGPSSRESLFYLPPPVPPCAVVWHTQGLHVYTQACNVTGVWPGGKTTESRSYKLSKEIPPLSTPIVPPVQIVLSETGPHLVSERRGRDFNFDIPNPIFFLLRITIFSMPVLGDEYIVFVYFWILLYVPSSAILSASSSRNVSVDMHYLE